MKFFTAILLPIGVFSHAAMIFPRARNVETSHTCPTCANGPSVCGAGSGSQWHADEPAANLKNSIYTSKAPVKLVAGGMIEVELQFSAAHMGHFVVELCANPGDEITNECFTRLERDPTDNRFGPYLAETPEVFYLPENSCVQTFLNDKALLARFIMPEGVSSEHAILRFHWQSGNSCDASKHAWIQTVDPTIREWSNILYGNDCRAATSNLWAVCGEDCPNLDCRGEQFRNCADVEIIDGDKSTIVRSGVPYPGAPESGPAPGSPRSTLPPRSSTTTSTSTTTTFKEEGPKQTPPSDGPSEIDNCVNTIDAVQEHYVGLCQEYCRQYADPSSFGRTWCDAAGVPNDLLACVRTHQSSVCK